MKCFINEKQNILKNMQDNITIGTYWQWESCLSHGKASTLKLSDMFTYSIQLFSITCNDEVDVGGLSFLGPLE